MLPTSASEPSLGNDIRPALLYTPYIVVASVLQLLGHSRTLRLPKVKKSAIAGDNKSACDEINENPYGPNGCRNVSLNELEVARGASAPVIKKGEVALL